jgi:hypothetical protein
VGFLDKKSRIIDMVLTGQGKELLSRGELRFVYWSAFDDEIDYDPFIANSSSLSVSDLESAKLEQIENSLVREATTGYRTVDSNADDRTNVQRPIFDMPQGQDFLPQVTASFISSSITLEASQRKVTQVAIVQDQRGQNISTIGPYDLGYERINGSEFTIDLQFVPGSYPKDFKPEGFLVTVYHSGSDGLRKVTGKIDSNFDVTFGNDLILRKKD